MIRMRGSVDFHANYIFSLVNFVPPPHIRKAGLKALQSAKVLDSPGAQYLWAYLQLIKWKRTDFNDSDFLFFAVTLRSLLSVIHKTLCKYLMEAWRALRTLGFLLAHPKYNGTLLLLKSVHYMGKDLGNPKLTYCSISWRQITQWQVELHTPTQLDIIALSVVTLAFTTVRRVGSFLPKSKRNADSFPYITRRYIVTNKD